MKPKQHSPYILSLETSYACNLVCAMCPRSRNGDAQGIMPMSVFERIEALLGKFRFVHLSGFGEPLMNPALPEIIARIKQAGSHASFTTNGILLNAPMAAKILASGVDAINISIDAATAETYERTRGRGVFLSLIMNLREFSRLLQESKRPVYLQWIFLMMKSTIGELPEAVNLASELGFQRVVAKHMETAVSRENLGEALFNTGIVEPLGAGTEALFRAQVRKARAIAQKRGIELLVHPRRYRVGPACLAQPLETIFVDYAGNVSACCYLNMLNVRPYLPVQAGMEHPPDSNGVLGNLRDASLEKLLSSKLYRAFRRSWERSKPPAECRGCLQIVRMNYPEGEE
jgi:MoaA/NifB/PqqE/SkfB family radical SAM enzyme